MVVWFKLEGAASADAVERIPPNAEVRHLREMIKEQLKPKLDHVAAADMILSADSTTSYKPSAPVSELVPDTTPRRQRSS